jgi:stage III sporulation protein AD
MDIIKIIGIGFLTLIISILLKDIKREYSIYAVIIGTTIILFMSFDTLKEIINFINDISENVEGQKEFIKILIKMTGIAILTEYAVNLCKDTGENAIATKIDFAGKLILISLSIPIITTTLETLTNLL